MSEKRRNRQERKAEHQHTVEEMNRVIRRLDSLEYLILGGAMLLALIGGAVGAYLLSTGGTLSFFPTWVVLSLLLFVVPGGIALWQQRRERSRNQKK